jgi:hypothetical protein
MRRVGRRREVTEEDNIPPVVQHRAESLAVDASAGGGITGLGDGPDLAGGGVLDID